MILELIITAEDGPAISISGMPDLGPIPAAALATLDFTGENGYPTVAFFPFMPPLNFFLHPVKYLRTDDGFIVIFHIVLRYFSFILLLFLGQKIDSKAFLE